MSAVATGRAGIRAVPAAGTAAEARESGTAAGRAAARSRQVTAALATVLDPELDRPITELGFVHRVSVAGGRITARLRLPTYFCAPNFAWLMVDDARRALKALDWAAEVEVELEDHFASDEINAGVARGDGFDDAFPALADTDRLDDLRTVFLRKGMIASQGRIGRRLLDHGWTVQQLADARLGDLPERVGLPLLRRRRALGLPCSTGAPAFVDEAGRAVPASGIERHLTLARTTGVGIDANSEMCKGLFAVRYGEQPAEHADGDDGALGGGAA
ncbi:iron-sulfur cluster assembly protein [Streptomyces sp. DW26H14]|uniref:iron-sulfur cluster assembly protein n=1 Tax=Streptomyces sp. DW26H14 TaxID=3435395 RepID=UPI00403D730C